METDVRGWINTVERATPKFWETEINQERWGRELSSFARAPKETTQLAASGAGKGGERMGAKENTAWQTWSIRRSHLNKGILAFSFQRTHKKGILAFADSFLPYAHSHTVSPQGITAQLCTAPTWVLPFHSSELSSSNLLWEIRPPVESDCAKMLFMTEQLAEPQSCQFLQVIAYACWYAASFTPISSLHHIWDIS